MKTLILITCLFMLQISVTAQEKSTDFTATTNSGCTPLSVDFTVNTSDDGTFEYNWDFGNGETSNSQNPSVIFTNGGKYTITLIIHNGETSETISKTDYIEVFDNPSPDFRILEDTIGCSPYLTHFEETTTDNGADYAEYYWSFGDGSNSSQKNPIHTYINPDTFSLTLFVVDQNGCSGTKIKEQHIAIYKPVANFFSADTFSCYGSIVSEFENTSTAFSSCVWNFRDSESSTATNPTFEYTSPGEYSPELIVFDDHGCSDTIQRTNYIKITQIKSDFDIEYDTICLGSSIHFLNISENAENYFWEFGDDSTSTEISPDHQFNKAGDFMVKLTASGAGCNIADSVLIHVINIVANFEADKTFLCETPSTVQYTNKSVNADQYTWILKDTLKLNDLSPVVTYYHKGFFNTTLIASNKFGCVDTFHVDSCIEVCTPRPYFTPNNMVQSDLIQGCAPLTVQFENKTTYETQSDSVVSAYWVIGDTAPMYEDSPEVTLSAAGQYLVTLYVETQKGCKTSTNALAGVGFPQTADFLVSATGDVCASEGIQFTDISTDSTYINEWFWDFGDGSNSRKQNPTHLFRDTGFVSVELFVLHNGCSSSIKKDSLFYINGPIGIFNNVHNCDSALTVLFTNSSKGATNYDWDLGDGNTSTAKEFSHEYAKSGDYLVKLRTSNSETQCDYYYEKQILVRKPIADFEIKSTDFCKSDTIVFDPRISQDAISYKEDNEQIRYIWNFTNDSVTTNSLDTICYKYQNKGEFNVKLTIRDIYGCKDSTYKQIHVFNPDVMFTADEFWGCMPLNTAFSSSIDSDTTLTSFTWGFGDGGSSSEENPTHVYNQFDIYDVKLVVTDALGCTDSLFREKYIEAVNPTPEFVISDHELCENDTATFLCSNENIVSCFWKFENFEDSEDFEVQHIYTTEGMYDVELTVMDNHGCDSTLVFENYIGVQAYPEINFIADTTFINCYPTEINFTNLSEKTHTSDWNWNFGDNTGTSILENPSHSYTKPGIYDVLLIGETSYGCKNELTIPEYIEIGGPFAKMILDDTICNNSITRLIAAEQMNIYDLKWFSGDGYTYSRDTMEHLYTQTGEKYPVLLLVSDANHTCDKFITDTIMVHEFIAQFDYENCSLSGCVPFNAEFNEISDNAVSWSWDFGNYNTSCDKATTFNYTSAGIHTTKLVASDAYGCSDTLSIDTEVFPLPQVSLNPDSAICRGAEMPLQASGGIRYEWSPNEFMSSATESSITVYPDFTTTYHVNVWDHNSCMNTDSVKVTVHQEPTLNFNDTSIIIGEQIYIQDINPEIATMQWFPEYGIDCPDCLNPILNPLESTSYTIRYTDIYNCFEMEKQVNINIMKKYSIDVPNAFTPNGDGINDIIFVKGWGVRSLISFRIFNRYGETVFETNDYLQGWDGTYKGQSQSIGTYSYLAIVEGYNGKQLSKRGTIKLLK